MSENDVATILRKLAVIEAKVNQVSADIESDRAEYRTLFNELRGDLALHTSRQDTAVQKNKKKSRVSMMMSKV